MLRAFRVSRFGKLCNFKFLWTNNIVSNVHLHATQTIKTCITLIPHFCIKLKKISKCQQSVIFESENPLEKLLPSFYGFNSIIVFWSS